MIRLLRAAALGIALLPTAAFADTAPAGPPGRPELTDAQRQSMEGAMRQSFAQMQQLHTQERSAILGSLTPAHRAALASIVGNLAISPAPDYTGAARQIDAILSPNEARAVLSTHTQVRAQEQTLREQQRQAFESVLTPEQKSAMDARRTQFEASHPGLKPGNGEMRGPDGNRMADANRVPDAGHVLLMLSHDGGEHEHMMGHGGPGMGGPPPGGPN